MAARLYELGCGIWQAIASSNFAVLVSNRSSFRVAITAAIMSTDTSQQGLSLEPDW